MRDKILMSFGSAGAFAVGGLVSFALLYKPAPPLEVFAAEAVNSIVTSNKLQIQYEAKWNQVCDVVVDVAVVKDNPDKNVVWRKRGQSAPHNVGREVWTADVEIPDLPNGRYQYRTRFNNHCNDGRDFATIAPDVDFEIRQGQ